MEDNIVKIDLPYYDLTGSKISRAPLHEAYKSTLNIKQDKLNELVQGGHQIKRGKFNRVELKRLRKNWRRICRCYPEYSDPFYAFGFTYRPKGCGYPPLHCDDHSYRTVRRAYSGFKMIFRMAYKLDNRLICDIYQKCRQIFCFPLFKYHESEQISRADKNMLRKLLMKRDRWHVCVNHNISPDVIHIIKKKDYTRKPIRWSSEDDFCLESSIERQSNNVDPKQLPMYKIDWEAVKREMNSCGYQLVKQQIYRRWYQLHPELAGRRRDTWMKPKSSGVAEMNGGCKAEAKESNYDESATEVDETNYNSD